MSVNSPLEIQLLGKEYKVACPPEEKAALQAAAELLNTRLIEAGEKGKASGERLAVMVALNLAHELLTQRRDSSSASTNASVGIDSDEFARKIKSIETRIDAALNQ
ncbi:MAG TPA: cell division protein ZapA [Rhodocyclaceae bacterium]|jgi:cell division protein ZapA|nr:cell division protein ZapA [Rhodocyclaceae bacterium]